MSEITLRDQGRSVAFTYEDMLRYHGPRSPGGVAHAFKVLERAVPLLSDGEPPERRAIAVRTAFSGPGARDGFELVLRAVTEERYVVDPALARPERGPTRERFVFLLTYRDRAVTLLLRDGFVTEEFTALVGQDTRSPEEDGLLDRLKLEMAERVMGAPADEVYDVSG